MKHNISHSIQSKRDKGYLYFFILFSGIFVILLSALNFITKYQEILSSTYGIIELLVFMIFFGLFPIYFVLLKDKIIVNEVKISIYSFWGYKKRDIYLDEIVSWNEIDINSKYGFYYKLIIRTKDVKYSIESFYYYNYDELKNQIVRSVPS